MTLYGLCLEYLDALNLMTSQNDSRVFSNEYEKEQFLKASLGDAINIRIEIAKELECDIDRLIMITDSLNIAIDFIPPLERHDSIRVYARNLEQLLTCAAGRMFLSGKAYKLTTAYGVIKETTPLPV